MSSILTNNGAMVALQTLKGINSAMDKTQNEISTGKTVATAKDNAAVWAISKVMESDVKGFEGIQDSLALGESTVAVGRNAAESITDLLKEVKGKIVSAQESNVDRAKLQTDIKALTDQVKSVVGSAQFNGLNLVDGTSANPVNVLSSLDRASDGSVTASYISVASSNLSTDQGQAVTSPATVASASVANGANMTTAAIAFQGSSSDAISDTDPAADKSNLTQVLAGDVMTATVNGTQVSYKVKTGDEGAAIAAGFQAALTEAGVTGVSVAEGTTANTLEFTNSTGAAINMSFDGVTRGRGDMAALETMDVTTDAGAKTALEDIENLIGSAIDTAASFGSAQKRIEIQKDFVGKLTDSLKSGIGSMVDADMEEVSARLQALQVQQQLGTQSLSIANKAPQALLSLFR